MISVPYPTGGSSVVGPVHLEDTGRCLDAFHAQPLAELRSCAQVFDEL
jgi:hypothetical protein